jgi:integrase
MRAITPHAVRHTWATWHYCVHRDLLQLRDDGGWETVKMLERYAKKMPDAYRAQIVAWWGARAESVQPASEEEKTATRSAV